MEEREFHLCREPWICVMEQNYHIKMVTLEETLLDAEKYRGLAGETESQNIAILRLLLAVLHTVFSRQNENGEKEPIESAKEARRRWKAIWDAGTFPEKPIQEYFTEWEDRFWLFDPVYPFYQVPGIEACEKKRYPAKKMNGLLVESNNKYTKKLPLFSMRSGKKKDELGYAEAARWLIYLLNFDDAALKPKSKMCHTANLGVVVAKGDSLFETLMLNLTLLQDGMKSWGEAKPLWERQKFSFEEFKERPAPVPDNQPELLTLQCRSVLLHREDKVVTSYTEFAGKYISEESAFEEQMTFWTEQKKNGVVGVYPKAHDQSRQMWRDFSVLLGRNEKAPKPGVVAWITMLQSKNLLPKGKFVSLGIVGIKYGEKSCGVSDEFSDTLQIHANLLDDLGKAWQEHIKNEIERCDKLAKAAGELGYGLNMAAGGNDKSAKQARQRAKEQAYYRLDIPFRQWLLQVDPEQDTEQQNACRMTWRDMSLKIVRNLGKEMADQAGNTAIVGRVDPEKRHHSAPEAFNSFLIRLKRIDQ